MHQVLDETERAQPAAGYTPYQDADEPQVAQDDAANFRHRSGGSTQGPEEILHRTYGTG